MRNWGLGGMGAQRVNLLSIGGAAVGVVSMFITWGIWRVVYILQIPHGAGVLEEYSLVAIFWLGGSVFGQHFALAIGLFMTGTAMAFVTPLGGFLQLAGASAFLWTIVPDQRPTVYLGAGPFVGLIAGIVTLAGLLRPIGIGYEGSKASLLGRLLTVTRSSKDFRLNLLALVGGIVGLACVFLPWMTYAYEVDMVPPVEKHPFNLLNFLTTEWFLGSVEGLIFVIVALTYLAGAIASLLTPVGGLAQFAASVIFAANVVSHPESSEDYFDVGFYAGIGAAIVVLVSFAFPVGVGWRGKGVPEKERLFVWHLPARSA